MIDLLNPKINLQIKNSLAKNNIFDFSFAKKCKVIDDDVMMMQKENNKQI